jgi:hypothetical protein
MPSSATAVYAGCRRVSNQLSARIELEHNYPFSVVRNRVRQLFFAEGSGYQQVAG